MKTQNLKGRWLIAPALFFAFCSTGNSPTLTSASQNVFTICTDPLD